MMGPAHYSTDVRLHLNAPYDQQRTGRGGPVLWPARSPDLTCRDYFLWGYVKSLVYETPVNSAEDLVARIAAAAGEVRDTPGIFANVRSSMRRRILYYIHHNNRAVHLFEKDNDIEKADF
ncbi:hypothetical protein AVEN_140398-1 [Araneus ventricosus]|uniref:Uncharacterized protein n=1 Tax=Araneus ventricosus TaxID=182803 RepID=A0A4Y2KHX1_ARAVE|nr:hypothetical protein AVEN_140398-1 [Araneus ventricosus]